MGLSFFPVSLEIFDGSGLAFCEEVVPIISSDNSHTQLPQLTHSIYSNIYLSVIKELLDIHSLTKEVMNPHRVECVKSTSLLFLGESDFTSRLQHFLDSWRSGRSTSHARRWLESHIWTAWLLGIVIGRDIEHLEHTLLVKELVVKLDILGVEICIVEFEVVDGVHKDQESPLIQLLIQESRTMGWLTISGNSD